MPASKIAPPIPPTTPPMIFLDELDRPVLPPLLDPGSTPGVIVEVAVPVVDD